MMVDKNVNKNGNTHLAQAYLNYMFSPKAWELVARYFFRPRNAKKSAKYSAYFPKIQTFNID